MGTQSDLGVRRPAVVAHQREPVGIEESVLPHGRVQKGVTLILASGPQNKNI
jgi:hypothetical protein